MSNLKGISLVMIFITVTTIFIYASNQMMPEQMTTNTCLNNSTRPEYKELSDRWDPLGWINPFTYLRHFYDIMTFKVFGLPPEAEALLQRAIYIPLSIITFLCIVYFVRGN